jgi:hypothetical protein
MLLVSFVMRAATSKEILKHVQQQKGRLDTFGYDYFKAYKQAGQNYGNNGMEQEAEAGRG